MLPPQRTIKKAGKGKKKVPGVGAPPVQKFRESPMTQPEIRYYKDGPEFRVNKNIREMHSGMNHIAHEAPAPEAHPRGQAKCNARMMTSSIGMFPNEKDKDTFVSPAKRSAAASNQFATSADLYGTDPPRPAQKKMSAVKIAEIGGSDTVNPLTHGQMQSQKL